VTSPLQSPTGYTILGSHTDGYEEFYLLGYNAIESVDKSTDVAEEHFTCLKLEVKQKT
jgi:hypothetical protein